MLIIFFLIFKRKRIKTLKITKKKIACKKKSVENGLQKLKKITAK
jgi:hypothetical protein